MGRRFALTTSHTRAPRVGRSQHHPTRRFQDSLDLIQKHRSLKPKPRLVKGVVGMRYITDADGKQWKVELVPQGFGARGAGSAPPVPGWVLRFTCGDECFVS